MCKRPVAQQLHFCVSVYVMKDGGGREGAGGVGVLVTHRLVLSPPGGRGCYRTPWELPSASTCWKPSDYPRSRWSSPLTICHDLAWSSPQPEALLSHALCLCVSAGLHLTADGPVRLWRFLCIHHALLNKSASGLLLICPLVVPLSRAWHADSLCLCVRLHRAARV